MWARGQGSGQDGDIGALPRASLSLASPQRQAVWVVIGLRRQPRTCYYRDSRRREGAGARASGGGLMGLEKAQGCIPD